MKIYIFEKYRPNKYLVNLLWFFLILLISLKNTFSFFNHQALEIRIILNLYPLQPTFILGKKSFFRTINYFFTNVFQISIPSRSWPVALGVGIAVRSACLASCSRWRRAGRHSSRHAPKTGATTATTARWCTAPTSQETRPGYVLQWMCFSGKLAYIDDIIYKYPYVYAMYGKLFSMIFI